MLAYTAHFAVMARANPDPESPEATADRMRLTRKALGYTQATMSHLMGSQNPSAWANYETHGPNWRRIDIVHALRLCATTGITTDWIYRGKLGQMPADLVEKLLALMKPEQPRIRKINEQS